MKYYTYINPDPENPDNSVTITKSEDEIRREYQEYWYSKMCNKYGKADVDSKFNPSVDCIADWVTINWAYETNEKGESIMNPSF